MWAILQTIKGSWLKHIVTQLSALFIMTATFGVALFIILSTGNIKNVFNIWGKVNESTVYVDHTINDEHKTQLENYLNTHPMVSSVTFESSAQAAQKFNEKFKSLSHQKFDSTKISQFFPPVYKIKFKETHLYKKDGVSLDTFTATLTSKFSFIKDVSYGKAWLSRYENVMSAIESMSWLIVVVMLMASLFVSSNVIKTVLFSKREEIEILEFIGADNIWIYGPHIINILMISSLSFWLALVINYSVFNVTHKKLSLVLSEVIYKEISFLSIGSVFFYFTLIMVGIVSYSIVSLTSLMPKNNLKTVRVDGFRQ